MIARIAQSPADLICIILCMCNVMLTRSKKHVGFLASSISFDRVLTRNLHLMASLPQLNILTLKHDIYFQPTNSRSIDEYQTSCLTVFKINSTNTLTLNVTMTAARTHK